MDGADSAATSSTDTSIFASARPTPGLAELDDDPHVGAQLTGQQRRFQGQQVVVEGADDGGRAGQARVGQRGGRPGTGREVRDAPPGQLAGERRIRVVVDDHGGHAGQVELLDDTQADTAQAAHDHVPSPVRVAARHPGIIRRTLGIEMQIFSLGSGPQIRHQLKPVRDDRYKDYVNNRGPSTSSARCLRQPARCAQDDKSNNG